MVRVFWAQFMVLVQVQSAAAQEPAVISGRVVSEFGGTPPSAGVVIGALGLTAAVAADGRYSLTIPSARLNGQRVELRARAIGYIYESATIALSSGNYMHDFTLRRDFNRLETVVVAGAVAATEQKKLPFSLTSLDSSDMPVRGANLFQQLQGKIPGAHIVQPSGQPGASPAIVLRGPKSLNAIGRQQGPLIIVDGAIIGTNEFPINDTQAINPDDVESLEVIKGAAATTLYGSRAGAGVIQITTRSGRREPQGTRFGLTNEIGLNDVQGNYAFARRHVLTMDERQQRFCIRVAGLPPCSRTVDFEAESRRVNDVPSTAALLPYAFERDYALNAAAPISELKGLFQINRWPKTYDPMAQSFRDGVTHNTTADATGRSGDVAYYASLSNLSQEGAVRFLRGYRRKSARVNLDQRDAEAWSFGLNTTFATAAQTGASSGPFLDAWESNFLGVTRVPPSVDLLRRDQQGRLYIRANPLARGLGNANPLYAFENNHGVFDEDRFVGSLHVRYTPVTWLRFEGVGSTDRRRWGQLLLRDREYRTTDVFGTPNGGTQGAIFENTIGEAMTNTMLTGVVTPRLGEAWRGTVTTRFSFEHGRTEFFGAYGERMAFPGLATFNNATALVSTSSSRSLVRSIGVIYGAQMEYMNRYIFDGLVRHDGSSLFGADERWHPYYRASLAWRVSDEPFWRTGGVATDVKLRASLGTAGGRPNPSAQYERFLLGSAGVTTAQTLGNARLKPEHTREVELGIDAELLRRLGLTITWAWDVTTDQLLPVPAPVSSGFPAQWQNAGTLDGKTWEVSLRVPLVAGRDLSWTTQLSWDRHRTWITALNTAPFFQQIESGPFGGAVGYRFFIAPGERYGTIYGRKYATACHELPSPFDGQCGPGKEWQANNEGYIVWVGEGNSPSDGITRNLWQASRPGCVRNGTAVAATGVAECRRLGGVVNAPWGAQITHWGMPTILRDSTAAPGAYPLGNTMPDYRLTMSHSIQWKRLTAYALLDASRGNDVYNMERHWSLGDLSVREIDQDGASVEHAKPIGYYWRGSQPLSAAGVGGFYGDLLASNRTVEDGSYTKLRELRLAYDLGRVPGMAGRWTVGLSGRNLYTWTKYSGWDPEAGVIRGAPGSAALTTGGMFQYPPTRSFALTLSGRF